MRLLVLGGTRFLGRAIVDDAVSRGYDVTTFTRGLSGHPRPGAEALHGDRTNADDLRELTQREWDGVIDTSTLAPAHVLASAEILAPRVQHYTYISTISVYATRPGEGVTEDSPVLDCPADATGTVETLGYGELKAGAERAVAAALPGRGLIVRPGLIVGPHEDVGRLPWWLARMARGGTVLAPGEPGQPVRMTDARDLASWVVDNTRRGLPATINVPGPEGMSPAIAPCAPACGTGRSPTRCTTPGCGSGRRRRPAGRSARSCTGPRSAWIPARSSRSSPVSASGPGYACQLWATGMNCGGRSRKTLSSGAISC